MINNIDDIKALINQQDWLEVKKISILKRASSNFCKFVDNFLIIKRLYEIEKKVLSSLLDGWECLDQIFRSALTDTIITQVSMKNRVLNIKKRKKE